MGLFAGTKYDLPPTCDRCGKTEAECSCPPPLFKHISPSTQTARLSVEKRKKGKLVTVIRRLTAADSDLIALLSRLKAQCGAGGTIQDGNLEVQGDHLQRISAVLKEIGFRVKP